MLPVKWCTFNTFYGFKLYLTSLSYLAMWYTSIDKKKTYYLWYMFGKFSFEVNVNNEKNHFLFGYI